MSTENEEWRENSFNEENAGAGRDGNRSYNREGGERPYRPSYNREGGDRPYRPRFNANNEGGDRPQRSYGDRPQRPRFNSEGGSYGDRSQRPRFNSEGGSYGDRPQRPRFNSEGGSYGDRPQRPRFNSEGGDRPYRPRFNNGEGGDRPQRPYNREGGDRPYRPRFNNGEGGGYRSNNGGGYRPRFNNDRQGGYRPRPRTADYDPNAKYSVKKQIEYKEQFVDPNEPIRLNKFMANAGICSRREADEFIQAGEVLVNGVAVTELGTKITRNDTVTFRGKVVTLERKIYVLLNKPKDCVTTSDDPQGRLTVMDIVRNACTERIYPVGRLDRNTTGVLLLTNDGDLASKLTHPKFIKKKIYHVWLDRDVSEEDMQRIADGIELEDGPIQPDAVSYANETDMNQVGIEIHSGRNRIVRRIFEALGYRVVKLDRVYFAGLTKKNLQRGRWRYLTQQEVNMLQMGSFE